jgi:hypothetical protein
MQYTLFIGHAKTGEVVKQLASNTTVINTETCEAALGYYVHFVPAIIVLDYGEDFARDAFMHLDSMMGASPHRVEGLILIGDDAPDPESPHFITTRLPYGAAPLTIVEAMRHTDVNRQLVLRAQFEQKQL